MMFEMKVIPNFRFTLSLASVKKVNLKYEKVNLKLQKSESKLEYLTLEIFMHNCVISGGTTIFRYGEKIRIFNVIFI